MLGRLVFAIEFYGFYKGGSSLSETPCFAIGQSQVILDLGGLRSEFFRRFQVANRNRGVASIQCVRPALVELRRPETRASRDRKNEETQDEQPGK